MGEPHRPDGLLVYCEAGACTKPVRTLQRVGRIRLVMFRYDENRCRHTSPATPSAVTVDTNRVTCDATFLISETSPSDRFGYILEIVGCANRADALHIDSAYKSGASAFLTSDNDDIRSHRQKLEQILAIRFFNPTVPPDWVEFLALVSSQ